MTINRDWRRFLLFVSILLLVGAPAAIFLPAYRNLIFLLLYSIPSNSIVPIPHEPAMVFFGRFYAPALVAIVAAIGTLVPCFLDYKAVTRTFRSRKLRKVRESNVYQGAVHYFLKAPFITVLLAAFAPFIPFYIFRVLSPSSGYPLRRYMVAVFLGRFPRYYLFALMGNALSISHLALACGGLLALCAFLYTRIKRHLTDREWEASESSEFPLESSEVPL